MLHTLLEGIQVLAKIISNSWRLKLSDFVGLAGLFCPPICLKIRFYRLLFIPNLTYLTLKNSRLLIIIYWYSDVTLSNLIITSFKTVLWFDWVRLGCVG